ncbi:PRD domain-containing protein, partial [Enterococcus faecium]
NLSQNEVHSDPDLILYNPSVLIDKEPKFFGIVFDEESLNYQRIITHLQFFAQRYLKGEGSDEQDEFLYALVQGKYPKAFHCVERINEYLRQTQKQEMGIAEQIYLTIHIQRVVSEKKSIQS